MRYSIVVRQSSTQSESAATALTFCRELLARQHEIYRVFFYQDAVYNASNLQQWPTDEPDISQQWQSFVKEHGIDLVVCIAAALKRGVINQEEAKRYDKKGANLYDGYALSGLGQLVEATSVADRVISF